MPHATHFGGPPHGPSRLEWRYAQQQQCYWRRHATATTVARVLWALVIFATLAVWWVR